MFGKSVKIDKELYERARKHAEKAGYPSIEELVAHALEKEISRSGGDDLEEQVRDRLRGLGYLS